MNSLAWIQRWICIYEFWNMISQFLHDLNSYCELTLWIHIRFHDHEFICDISWPMISYLNSCIWRISWNHTWNHVYQGSRCRDCQGPGRYRAWAQYPTRNTQPQETHQIRVSHISEPGLATGTDSAKLSVRLSLAGCDLCSGASRWGTPTRMMRPRPAWAADRSRSESEPASESESNIHTWWVSLNAVETPPHPRCREWWLGVSHRGWIILDANPSTFPIQKVKLRLKRKAALKNSSFWIC